jgi:hypothetical protein
MIVKFFDMQDESNPLNGLIVGSDKELAQLLDGFRTRDPFFAELRGENGYNLLIGIGSTIGCVQYSHGEGDPPYLVALATPPISRRDDGEFLAGDTPTPIPARNILPFEQVKQIAIYFRETGAPSPGVSWEEV